jgi:FixJ family two-component response regulator
LKFSLELEGFAVRIYGGAAEVFADGKLEDGDCLVVDQRMPDMNGMELIARLRERHVRTPAILLLSKHNPAVSMRAALAEVPVVEMPLFNNALVDKIREACRPHGA